MDKFIELTTAFLSRHFIPLDEGNRKRIVEDTVGTVDTWKKKKKKKKKAQDTTTTTAAAPFPTTPPTTTAGRRQAVAAAAKVVSSGLGKNVVYNTTSGGGGSGGSGGSGGGGSSGSTMKSSWVRSHYKRQGYTFMSSCLALYIDADVDLTKVSSEKKDARRLQEGCKKVARRRTPG